MKNIMKICLILGSLIAALFSVPASAANKITVTVENHTAGTITLVSSSGGGSFPSALVSGQVATFTIDNPWSTSDVQATYMSPSGTGGCKFAGSHTTNSSGPVYSSSAEGYGTTSSSFCLVFLTEKWSVPYDYKLKFSMFQ